MSFQCHVTGYPRLIPEDNPKDKKVEQHHRDMHSPAYIMRQARERHVAAQMLAQPLSFVDDTVVPSTRQLYEIFRNAKEAVNDLPIEVRAKFPTARHLLGFLGSDNPENRAEAERLGIVKKRVEPPKSDADRIIEAINTLPGLTGKPV